MKLLKNYLTVITETEILAQLVFVILLTPKFDNKYPLIPNTFLPVVQNVDKRIL